MRFLVISLTVNAALTQGQALRPSTPSDARSLEYTEAQHLERAIPAIDVASSSDVTLGEAVVEGREEMTGLAVRQSDTTALSVRQSESHLEEGEIAFEKY